MKIIAILLCCLGLISSIAYADVVPCTSNGVKGISINGGECKQLHFQFPFKAPAKK